MPVYKWGINIESARYVKRAFDANGLDIKDRLIELNTDTGEAVIIKEIDDYVRTERVRYTAPITIIWV